MRRIWGFVALSCSFVGVASAQVTAIRAGRLVDPDSGTVLSDQIILVRDSKIESVGKGLPIPSNLVSLTATPT